MAFFIAGIKSEVAYPALFVSRESLRSELTINK